MSLINSDYFIRDIAIPASKYTTIQNYIDRYENKIIYDLFGYELGKLVIAYDSETSPQRIKDIVEGKEYTITQGSYFYPVNGSCYNAGSYKRASYYRPGSNEVTIKWNGLVNSDKISLLAYWVYYWYCRENEQHLTGVGGAESKLENAVNAGYSIDAASAWHKMRELYGYFQQVAMEPSCFNFMYEHQEDYQEWVFKSKELANRFGV